VLLIPPAHPLARRHEPLPLAELARLPLLVNEPRIGYSRMLLDRLAESELAAEIVGDCDDLESLKYMVIAGAGVALAPRIIAEDEVTRGSLRALPIEGRPRIAIQLVSRPEPLAPRSERIRALLAKELA
jgi:DNA-binding transcriptional LysR family regulator